MHPSRILRTSLLALCAASFAAAQPARHPLDDLTASEYWAIFEAMKASGHIDDTSRYAGILLKEPPKAEVLQWKTGQPFRREALAVVKQGRRTFEAVVDISGRKLVSWKEVEGVEPNLIRDELEGLEEQVRANPDWLAAIRRRGIRDLETVTCDGGSPGYFGTQEEKGRRLERITCADIRGAMHANGRPIEGLVVVWDPEARKVIRVIDTGAVPVPQGPTDYDVDSVGPLREPLPPILLEQPQGPGFRIEGHEVAWQNWRFHFRSDPRAGLVLSMVRYNDGGRERSVLYEGSLSEIFVPYMDPSEGWYHWTYLDAGEGYNLTGGIATPLEPGTDCPPHAVFFDSVVADQRGIPHRRPRTACLFELSSGDFAWRHQAGPEEIESRTQRDLVLRSMATIGNYDYAIDWVLLENGSIKVRVGATGILAVKAVKSRTASEDRDGRDAAYGHFLAENTVGPNHDHYFCFRLDVDIDGTSNSFVREDIRPRTLPEDHPRRSVWIVEPHLAKVEEEAQLHMMMEKPALWRVINPNVKGPYGNPVSYQIQPGHNAMTLLSPDDYPRRRASFIDHHLWVTPQRDEERWAAGDYPTQSKGGDGLAAWTRANRRIDNTDIVVWYTLGMHHPPRQEDWPVMPTVWHEFELRPFDFFSRNPALDLSK